MSGTVDRRGPASRRSAGSDPGAGSGAATQSGDKAPGRARFAGLRADFWAALPGWVCARAVVGAALAMTRFLITHVDVRDPRAHAHSHEVLFAWDAGFYRGIAATGYRFGAIPHEALRFFPLVPLLARAVGVVLGGRPALGLLLVVNGSALAVGMAIHRLVLNETRDRSLARRAAWLVALAPPAYVLVLGYAEATFMLCAIVCVGALRTRRWWLAAAFGALAALTRPLGTLLVVPAAVEVFGAWRILGGVRQRIGAAVAIVAPAAGTALYLGWVGLAYGHALLPFSIQQEGRLRGRSVDPISALSHEGRGLVHGQHVGSGLHVVWAVLFVGLLVVMGRRWPRSYTLFGAATLLVALASRNLDSMERYVFSCFPFVLAAATLMRRAQIERAMLALTSVALSSYAFLAFFGAIIP